MPPPPTTTTHKSFCLNDQAQIAWFTSTRGLVQYFMAQYSTVQYSTVQSRILFYHGKQECKWPKGQNVIEVNSRLGHLKNISISSELVFWRRSILLCFSFLTKLPFNNMCTALCREGNFSRMYYSHMGVFHNVCFSCINHSCMCYHAILVLSKMSLTYDIWYWLEQFTSQKTIIG